MRKLIVIGCAVLVMALSATMLFAPLPRAAGEAPAKSAEPFALCHKCGEIKGSESCCVVEGREKCDGCGLLKGSPGCCKIAPEASAVEKQPEKHEHGSGCRH